MAEADSLRRWEAYAKILATPITLFILLLGGGFFYNNIWNVPSLKCQITSSSRLAVKPANSLVIQNEGRSAAHDIVISVWNLSTTIIAVQIPRPSEGYTISRGGEGFNHVIVHFPRLSRDSSLELNLVGKERFVLLDGQTLSVTSEELGRVTCFAQAELLYPDVLNIGLTKEQLLTILNPKLRLVIDVIAWSGTVLIILGVLVASTLVVQALLIYLIRRLSLTSNVLFGHRQ